jgi:RNA polymerase sigma factor (sigma-70 family)
MGDMAPTPLTEASDAEAIRRSLREPDAFRVVFERHFDAVHRYAQRRVGPDAADEVAAETFVRAFDNRRRYDVRRADAKPWLLGIAANLLLRHWQRERRRLDSQRRAQSSLGAVESADGGAGDAVAALDALAPHDREALLLFAWADLSYEEIAAALEVPIGTVRSRLARARRQMREQLVGRELIPSAEGSRHV